jgi:ERCC4-related helicase
MNRKEQLTDIKLPLTELPTETEYDFISIKMKNSIYQVMKQFYSCLRMDLKVFKNSGVTRIWNEHKNELALNLCPKCNKIARTHWAEECRFCLHTRREERK